MQLALAQRFHQWTDRLKIFRLDLADLLFRFGALLEQLHVLVEVLFRIRVADFGDQFLEIAPA